MVLDDTDILAVKHLPLSLKDTIRRILPYINDFQLDTIIADVREGRDTTTTTTTTSAYVNFDATVTFFGSLELYYPLTFFQPIQRAFTFWTGRGARTTCR